MQYDNGQVLTASMGGVLNASTGALLGTLYSTANTVANGPVVSDSVLGRAFLALSYTDLAGQVLAFDDSNFNLIGSIPANGSEMYRTIVRWGQNGLAANTPTGSFGGPGQIYILQSPLVKDLSPSPADLSISLNAGPRRQQERRSPGSPQSITLVRTLPRAHAW